MSLEFGGIRNQHILLMLLGCVCAILAVFGIWQLVRRRTRYGLICLTAAFPPLLLALLVADLAVQYSRGDTKAGHKSLLGAAALAGGLALVAALVAGASDRTAATWMGWLGLQVAVAVAAFYGMVFAYLGTGRLVALMALRCAAILALLLVLFKPAITVTAGEDEFRVRLPILVDRSGSMATADEAGVPERYIQAVQMLATQQERLNKHFRPSWYHFAERVQQVEKLDMLAALRPAGAGTDGTDLAAAIRAAVADHSRKDLPGLLILTDGIHNTSQRVLDAAVEAGVPIYTIGVGTVNETLAGRRNIQLISTDAPMEAVKNNVATITVQVKMTALASVPGEVRLYEGDSDQPVDTQQLWTDKNIATLTVKMKWTPRERPGGGGDAAEGRKIADVRTLRIEVPPNPSESVTEDNAAELHVLVIEPRIRVLYVEGTIRPEYKYLRRLLDSDPNIEFMALVRISGNKFWAQGALSGRKLTRLPTTADDFALIDVLMLGDLDRTFLTTGQLEKIRQFVNDGGGLLMLGGHNSFGPGGYGGTPVDAALPVSSGSRTQPQESTPFLPRLTAAGEAHPILDGLAGYFPGPGGRRPKADLAQLPELRGCVTVARAKPAASVLAVHPDRRNEVGPLIVMAAQQFGAGRSVAFTPDTTWQWYLPLGAMGADSPYRRFWGQTIRWLARAETKSRLAAPAAVLRLSTAYMQVGEEVKLYARVQDQKGQATDAATVATTITSDQPGTQPEALPLVLKGAGMFEGTFKPPGHGRYTVKLTAVDSTAETLGTDELGVFVASHSRESDRLARNDNLLVRLAARTDGRFADISGLPEMVDLIVNRQKGLIPDAPEAEDYLLYNFPALFLAFVVLLTGEWLLRRNWQLH